MSVFDNMKAASGTGTARGTFPIIKNSANGKMKNLKLFGASTQAANPTPDNPQEISSVVLNSIAACGKNLFGFEKNTIDKTTELRKLVEQRLIFTKIDDNKIKCNYNGGSYSLGYVEINGIDGTKDYSFSFVVKDNTLGFTPRIEKHTQECTKTKLVLMIYAGNGATIVSSDQYFTLENIQVEAGTTATDFEPYKGNIANLPETFEMNGIDEVKDYIDFERGVFVQRFKEKHITKSDMERFTQATNGNYIATYPLNDEKLFGKCICTHFKGIHTDDRIILANMFRCYLEGDSRLYFRDIADNSLFSNATNSLAFFENNDVCVWYELAEPIATPLSPAALLELNKLRTFDSITCVSNDAGAEMEIDYFKNNASGQAMSDIHAGVPRFVLEGTTLHIIV